MDPSMNPLFRLRRWSPQDMNRLMKFQGIIEDIDGECSFKVSGLSCEGCQLSPHYRIPLHALNKKFGLYRMIVAYLDKSSHKNATRMRDLYLSIMDYMNDVRIAFMEDSASASSALCGNFRSPAFDYYLWLDHTIACFDSNSREALEKAHGVTFEGLQNATCPDILVFIDWRSYHNKECKYHDCCGALQSVGGGEDLQRLLDALQASLNPAGATVVQHSGSEPTGSMTMVGSTALVETDLNVVDMQSDMFPPFPLPLNQKCQKMALRTLGGYARQILVRGFGRWLPSHIAMRLREIQGLDHNETLENLMNDGLLITARNHEEFFEIFGMVEMISKCQDLLVDRGSMARFFHAVGLALYTSRQGSVCSVEYGQDIPLSISPREQLPMPTETRNMSFASSDVPTNVQDHPSHSHSHQTQDAEQHYRGHDDKQIGTEDTRSFIECEVQTDSLGVQLDVNVPGSLSDSGTQPSSDVNICDYDANINPEDFFSFMEYEAETAPDIEHQLRISQSNDDVPKPGQQRDLEMALNSNLAVIPQHDEAVDLICTDHTVLIDEPQSSSEYWIDIPDPSTKVELDEHRRNVYKRNRDISQSTSPPLKSRLRERHTSRPQKDSTNDMKQPVSKLARPVVFANNRQTHRAKSKPVNPKHKAHQYTIKDLVCESHTDWTNNTPLIDAFLMDPQGYKFVESTIESDHNSWLAVAQHVALRVRKNSISNALLQSVSKFMSIQFWFKDIAMECQQALVNKCQDVVLSPLAHCVLVELSNKAMIDERSVRSVLQSILKSDNGKCAIAVLRYLLSSSQPHDEDPYAPGLRVIASVVVKDATGECAM